MDTITFRCDYYIIIIGGILAFVISVGCCMLLCRYYQFSSLYCCEKSNSGRGIEFYREQYYGHTPGQIIKMRSLKQLPSRPHDTRYQYQEIEKKEEKNYTRYATINYSHKQRVNNNTNQYQEIEKKEEKNEDNGTV